MKKRMISLLLAVLMLVNLLPMGVLAAELDDAEAAAAIFAEFSKYSNATKTELVFPLEYDGASYTNVIEYMKAWAKVNTGRDITVNYTAKPYQTNYVDWSTGQSIGKSYTGLAENGDILQDYFTNNADKTLNYLENVTFTVGDVVSDAVAKVYIKVRSLVREPQEVVDYIASSMNFARIANGSTDAGHVVNKLGEASGSNVLLPNTTGLYNTTSASVTWKAENISGKADALTVNSSRAVTINRPAVGEEDAVFDLTAAITSKTDTAVTASSVIRVTVPAYEGVVVPVQVPSGAALTLKEGTAAVDAKYIALQNTAPEGCDLYLCTLHAGATGGAQKYSYTVEKAGYLTASGDFNVTVGENAPVVVELMPSTENDAKLASLRVSAPGIDIPNFDPDTTAYTVEVRGAESVTFAAEAAAAGATVKVVSYYKTLANANKGTLTTTAAAATTKCYLPTAVGESVIVLQVTAPAGSTQPETTRNYTVTVKKTEENMPMTALTLKAYYLEGGSKCILSGAGAPQGLPLEETLSPSFVSGANEGVYTCYVNYDCDRVTLTPTAAGSTITVNGAAVASGKASAEQSLQVGDNRITLVVTKGDKTTEYQVNVHRKRELRITDVTLDCGSLDAALSTGWTGTCSFDHDAEEVQVTYHTNLPPEEEAKVTVIVADGSSIYTGIAGQPITVAVGERESVMPTIFLTYPSGDVLEGQKYVISLKRSASAGASSVESYLPAPGQFVNDSAWRNAGATLHASSGGVTLGAFGGSIVYRFDEPIVNDPANPYGIDFLVMGNCFQDADGSTSSGAAEPAAVMVSADGIAWYELAGSEYYDAATVHGLSVTYTNPDTAFVSAKDVPWTDSLGSTGVVVANGYHTQPYYPNPAYYADWQKGTGANETYSAESVTFSGSKLAAKGFYPFGYADTHTWISAKKNTAENPYAADHKQVYNGDGFDLAWAVDANGNPVVLDSISYVKVYNPMMVDGGALGEASPEIQYISRTAPAAESVGVSAGLTGLKVNGNAVDLESGVYAYTIDAMEAASLVISPIAADEAANIYVSNQRVASGESTTAMEAVAKTRIIVQEGSKAPAIYTLTFTNVQDQASRAALTSLRLLSADTAKVPNEEKQIRFEVANSVDSVVLIPTASADNAQILLSGDTLEAPVSLTSGSQSQAVALNEGENSFTLTVTSANGKNSADYFVIITRKAAENLGSVRVIVENSTYSVADGAKWDGVLVDRWVELTENSTMMTAVVSALTAEGYTQTGAESNYISEINGLSAFDGGNMSGWMGTLNDWFTNEGFGAYAVADGTLCDGDLIDILYTCDFGEDAGGSWMNNDKSLKNIAFSAGTLSPAFDQDTHAYTLTVPADTESLLVTPTAANKNFQVRTAVGQTEYKRTAAIPVADGTVITVKCGDPAWPTMNMAEDVPAEVYIFTISTEQVQPELAIVTQPESFSGKVGETAEFTVEASRSDVTYQWHYSSNGGKSWSKSTMTGADAAALKVEMKAFRVGQMYKCIVTDSEGNSVESAVVSLTKAADQTAIVQQPANAAVAVGENAVFTVVAEGEGLTYQWMYSNNDGKSWSKSTMTGFDTASLTVGGKAFRNGQQYKCVVTDANSSTVESTPAVLTVVK